MKLLQTGVLCSGQLRTYLERLSVVPEVYATLIAMVGEGGGRVAEEVSFSVFFSLQLTLCSAMQTGIE